LRLTFVCKCLLSVKTAILIGLLLNKFGSIDRCSGNIVLAFILALAVMSASMGYSQKLEPNPNEYDPLKFKLAVAGGVGLYVGTMAGLYTIWYQDYEQTDFHFFDDNSGWMQVDKFGHMYSAYMFSKVGYRTLLWTGIDRKKAIWYGGSYGFVFLTSVEILDGHYTAWGASLGDIACNALGSALLISQELTLGHQAVTMKFSYNPSPLAEYRPDQLGSGNIERIIKDYNGQTYWFSGNYRSAFRNHGFVPKWFNLAFGYSAYGMLGGDENPEMINGMPLPEVERYRRYLFSLDVDWDKIKTDSKLLNSVFFFLNLVKVPFPTLEYNSKGEVVLHGIYF
jgi:hypothetical protein